MKHRSYIARSITAGETNKPVRMSLVKLSAVTTSIAVAMEPIVNLLFLSKEAGSNPLARVVTGVVAAGLSLICSLKTNRNIRYSYRTNF
jgi:hypothetical protein